ncbi:MAG: hypothetical protein IJM17_03690 [Firmicutes bacterium]|nr:hypothetical protein [Bacillota bacterium]
MKNLITGIACMIILSVFLVQISSYQAAHSRILFAETAVNSAVETARQDGCFTASNIARLRARLSARLGCDPSEIVINASSVPVMRGSMIEYSVSYPLKGIVAASKALGIADEDNMTVNTISGSAASEYTGR